MGEKKPVKRFRWLLCLLVIGVLVCMATPFLFADEGKEGIQPAVASNSYINADGVGFSAVPENSVPLGKDVKMTGVGGGEANGETSWPTGFNKNSSQFAGGIYDGNGHIWLVNYSGDKIVRVDTTTGEMAAFGLPADVMNGTTQQFVGGVYDNKGYIWMSPYNAEKVVRINTRSTDANVESDMAVFEFDFNIGKKSFQGGVLDKNGDIWMLPVEFNSAVKIEAATVSVSTTGGKNVISADVERYNISTAFSEYTYSKEQNQYFVGGVYDGEDGIWLIPNKGTEVNNVIRIDIGTGTMQKFNNWPSGYSMGLFTFYSGVYDGNGGVWMLPFSLQSSASIIRISTDTDDGTLGKMTEYKDWPENYSKETKEYEFAGAAFDGENIWMAPSLSNYVIRLNTREAVNGTAGYMKEYGYDDDTGKDKWTEDLKGFSKTTSSTFLGGVYDGNKVWFVPQTADRLVRLSADHDLELSTDTDDPVFMDDIVTVTGEAENKGAGTNNLIDRMEWFRTSTSDGTDYSAGTGTAFDTAYTSANTANKGAEATPGSDKNSGSWEFDIDADKNGTYWIKVYYNNEADYIIKSVQVKNIYKQSVVKTKGVDRDLPSSDPGYILYEGEVDNKIFGAASDLDGTVLATTVKKDDGTWDTKLAAEGAAKLTIEAEDLTDYDIYPDDTAKTVTIDVKAEEQTVTFEYTKTPPSEYDITEYYVEKDGTPITDSSNNPLSTTKTITSGDNYTGNHDTAQTTDYIYIGYKIGDAGESFDDITTATYGKDGPEPGITGVMEDRVVYFIYTTASIKIEKLDGEGNKLKDVEFKLERLDGNGDVDTDFTAIIMKTGDGSNQSTLGELVFKDASIKPGKYRITETESAGGNVPLKDPIVVDLPFVTSETPTDDKYAFEENGDYYYYNLTYTVTNQAQFPMPEAGNKGPKPYHVMAGAAIFAAAGGIWYYRRRRRLKEAINELKMIYRRDI